MQIPTVRACVGLIADKISSLPLKLYEKDSKVTEILNDNRCRLINHDTGDTINGTELKSCGLRTTSWARALTPT